MFRKLVLFTVLTLLVLCSTPVRADQDQPHSRHLEAHRSYIVFESFNSHHPHFLQPSEEIKTKKVWLINAGANHPEPWGVNAFQYFQERGSASSVTMGQDNGVRFLDLANHSDPNWAGEYVGAEAVSGCPTGWCHEGTVQPAPGGKTTVFSARMKYPANLDGTGATGSMGLWAWVPYVNMGDDGSFTGTVPPTAFGFGWVQAGGAFPGGMTIEIFVDGNPVHFDMLARTMPDINLQEWHTYQLIWSRDLQNMDTVVFKVDGTEVSKNTDPIPALPAMSLEIWNDNQHPDPTYTVVFTPPVEQHLLIDWAAVYTR